MSEYQWINVCELEPGDILSDGSVVHHIRREVGVLGRESTYAHMTNGRMRCYANPSFTVRVWDTMPSWIVAETVGHNLSSMKVEATR